MHVELTTKDHEKRVFKVFDMHTVHIHTYQDVVDEDWLQILTNTAIVLDILNEVQTRLMFPWKTPNEINEYEFHDETIYQGGGGNISWNLEK